ncbi:MAG: YopX family protein [Acutalibacteraceae bacterium]|nr:YopX family protein [Acutalibacteraceae bacterium]
MREILFRGKQVDNGEWVEGDFCHPCNIVFEAMGYDEVLGQKDVPVINDYAVIPETVGQYTGLTDKNGKKIFEGDIVKIAYYFGWDDEQEKNVPEEEYISKVYSIDGCPFCVDLLHCDGDMSPIAWLDWSYDDAEIEVIGNIHDNPELLKGGAE